MVIQTWAHKTTTVTWLWYSLSWMSWRWDRYAVPKGRQTAATYTTHNIAEEHRSQLHGGVSLESRNMLTSYFYFTIWIKWKLHKSWHLSTALKKHTSVASELWPIPFNRGPRSSVGAATDYGLDGPRIESWWRRNFRHLSRPALAPTQPPVRWVPCLSRG
jgi:hypothetical protein